MSANLKKRSTAAVTKRSTEAVKRRRKNKYPDPIDCIGKGSSVKFVPHPRLEALLVGDNNTLYTRNLVPGEALNREILLPIQKSDGTEVEYRHWNPSISKLAAAILCGADNIWMIKPGSRVLYLSFGDACGTTVSHISDLVGPDGMVYVMGRDKALLNIAEKRFNIVPIIESPYLSYKQRMLISMVDVMFASVEFPDQVMVVYTNARWFLKSEGHYMFYVKANYIDSTNQFRCLSTRRRREFKPIEQATLEPFDKGHAYIIGSYRTLEITEDCRSQLQMVRPRVDDGKLKFKFTKLKEAPNYILFESCSGYALFLTHDLMEVDNASYERVEEFINGLDQVFKLVAFHPFESADEVLEQYKAVSKGHVTGQLMEFLLLHLPKKPVDEEEWIVIGLSDPFMQRSIAAKTKLHTLTGVVYFDMMRGLRLQIDKFIKDMKSEDLGKIQREIAVRSFNNIS